MQVRIMVYNLYSSTCLDLGDGIDCHARFHITLEKSTDMRHSLVATDIM